MALKIIDDCIDCGACEPECPNSAIHEATGIYVIDPDHCTECFGYYSTQQCARVCPVESCVSDEQVVESRHDLRTKFQELYPGKILVNTENWCPPAF